MPNIEGTFCAMGLQLSGLLKHLHNSFSGQRSALTKIGYLGNAECDLDLLK